MAALDAGVPLCEVQIAARHSDPRTTTVVPGTACTFVATPPTSWSPLSPAANPTRDGTSGIRRHSAISARDERQPEFFVPPDSAIEDGYA